MQRGYQLVLGLWLLVGLPLGTHAATYTVSPSGSDSTPCGAGPRRTINQGIACLSGGDTLRIQAGTYDETITDVGGIGGYTVPVPSGSSWSQATTITAETPGTVTLRLTTIPDGWPSVIAFERGSQYIIVAGLGLDAQFRMAFGIGLSGSHHLRFQDLDIAHAAGAGIQGDCVGCEFLNLHIHDTAIQNGVTTCNYNVCANPPGQMCPTYCHAVYLTGTDNVIDGGSYHDSDGHAIHLYPGPQNNIVRNIEAYNNVVGIGIYGGGHAVEGNRVWQNGIGLLLAEGTTATNNVIDAARAGDGPSYGIFGKGTVTLTGNTLCRQVTYIEVDGDWGNVQGNRCDTEARGCTQQTTCEPLAPRTLASSPTVASEGLPPRQLRMLRTR